MSKAELERAYRDAIYEVDLPGGAVRFRIGDRLETPPFALVTAHNPGAARPGAEANAAANTRLETVIHAGGWTYTLARGVSADGSHEEASFAVFGITRDDALELAGAFGQAAIAWFDGEVATLAWTGERAEGAGP